MLAHAYELSRLADMPPGPRRDKITLALADAIAARRSPCDETYQLIGDVVMNLVVAAARDLRMSVAAKIADAPWAPRELALSLALDEFDVAQPVIERCQALIEEDLLAIAGRGSTEHRCALARRGDMTARVCDAVAEHGEPDVLVTLLRNTAAPLSPETLKLCVTRARTETQLHAPLVARTGLPAELVEAIYLIVGEELRATITQKYDVDEAALRRIVDAAAVEQARGHGDEADAPREDDETASLVRMLREAGSLTSDFIVRSVAQGKPEVLLHAASQEILAQPESVASAFKRSGAWAVALACRACDIPRQNFISIYKELARVGQVGSSTMADVERVAANTYVSESVESAADSLKRMLRTD